MPLPVEFTEQTEVAPCARLSCKRLVPKFQLQEVQNELNPLLSRFVCLDCYQHYNMKATANRDSAGILPASSQSLHERSEQVRLGTNLAQRRHGAAPPVQAISNQYPQISLPEPPVAIRSVPNPPHYSGHLLQPQIGYSAAHSQLGQHFIRHEARAQQVFRPRETFILVVKLAYWDDYKGKTIPIPQVMETHGQVDMHIGFIELKQKAMEVITTRLTQWLGGFRLDPKQLELRDKDYVLIQEHSRDVLIHYFELKTNARGIVKYRTNPRFNLYLIMPRDIYEAIEDYRLEPESVTTTEASTTIAHHHTKLMEKQPEAAIPVLDEGRKWQSEQSNQQNQIEISSDSDSSGLVEVSEILKRDKGKGKMVSLSITKRAPSTILLGQESQHRSSDGSIVKDSQVSPLKPGTKRKMMGDEVPATTPLSARVSRQFHTPDFGLLKQALMEQVEPSEASIKASLPVGNLYIGQIFVIPRRSLSELLKQPKMDLVELASESIYGTLEVDFKQSIGNLQGAFKTAHQGVLRANSSSPDGFPWNMKLAIKRPYYTKSTGRKPHLQRYVLSSELHELTQEFRCLVWGDALLELVYEFMNKEVDTRGPPDFPIPLFRFVRCAIIITRSPERIALLAEEYISGNYLKYMDNRTPVPFEDITAPDDNHRAQFLAFTQHVQWSKTGQQAFVTDFQGNDELLTDPQILTSPNLGGNLFSQGNLPGSFVNFPKQHICNQFCRFFGLELPEAGPSIKAFIGEASTGVTNAATNLNLRQQGDCEGN